METQKKLQIVLDIETYKRLQVEATRDSRALRNFIAKILKDYIAKLDQ